MTFTRPTQLTSPGSFSSAARVSRIPVTLHVSVEPQDGRSQQLGNISKMCSASSLVHRPAEAQTSRTADRSSVFHAPPVYSRSYTMGGSIMTCVTRRSAIRSSRTSGSKRSWMTSVPPRTDIFSRHSRPPEWCIGAVVSITGSSSPGASMASVRPWSTTIS